MGEGAQYLIYPKILATVLQNPTIFPIFWHDGLGMAVHCSIGCGEIFSRSSTFFHFTEILTYFLAIEGTSNPIEYHVKICGANNIISSQVFRRKKGGSEGGYIS